MNQLLTPQELAQWIHVPEVTLSQWRYLGRGPAYRKVGKFVRYVEHDVEAWLDEQARGGESS